MGAWRVEQHYGTGAANVRLAAEPYLPPQQRYSLLEGFRTVHAELRADGFSLRQMLALIPAIMLAFVLSSGFIATVAREQPVDRALVVEILQSRKAPPVAPAEAAPVVVPEPPRVQPAEPRPEPAAKPAPKPKPKPRARPLPKPPEVKIAMPKPPALEPPPRPSVTRREPSPRLPPPVNPSAVRVDPITPTPTATPAESRAPRASPPPRTPSRSARLAAPAVKLDPVESTSAVEPTRTRRFSPARPVPTATPRPKSELAPVVVASSAPAAAASLPARSERPTTRAGSKPALQLDLAPIAAATRAPSDEPGQTSRSARPLPSSRRPPLRSKIALVPSRLASRTRGSAAPSLAELAPRAGRASPPDASRESTPGRDDEKLRGVPLGSLQACVSDRQEDALKQRLVAAVTTQKKCASRAGTYRFIETKNLNSFLMWVDRDSSRKVGDRCAELLLALECLAPRR